MPRFIACFQVVVPLLSRSEQAEALAKIVCSLDTRAALSYVLPLAAHLVFEGSRFESSCKISCLT